MRYITLLMLIVLPAISCKREKGTVRYLPGEVKRNYFFKPGSYWVYKDSLSGATDSCWVSSSKIEMVGPENSGMSATVELMSIQLNILSSDTAEGHFKKGTLAFSPRLAGLHYEIEGVTGNVVSAFESACPIIPKDSGYHGQTITNLSYDGTPLNTVVALPALSVAANTYYKVAEIHYRDNICYMNDSLGLIKAKVQEAFPRFRNNPPLNDTLKIRKVWELQRCRIIK